MEVLIVIRKNVNTTLDQELYKKIKIIAVQQNKGANELLEEGMRYIIDKYENNKTNTN